MCGVSVVGPLNQGSPGMPSGHMTSPCVMTVPNFLLNVSVEHAGLFSGFTVALRLFSQSFGFFFQETVVFSVISATKMMRPMERWWSVAAAITGFMQSARN